MTGERTDIKEQLKEETGLEFFNKIKLWDRLKSVVGDLKDKLGFNKKTEESSQIFEIPYIFDDRTKSEIEENNEIIRHFYIPKPDSHVKNDLGYIRNLALKITDSREYRDLKNFIDNNMSQAIKQNFRYYDEDINEKMSKWKTSDIRIKEDTAQTFTKSFMRIFGDYIIDIIKSIYLKVADKINISEQEYQLYLNFLDVINRYISSVGIYAPCDVLGGMVYNVDDLKFKHFLNNPFSIQNIKLQGYVHSVDCLTYVMDYDYNGRIKSAYQNGSLYSFVSRELS